MKVVDNQQINKIIKRTPLGFRFCIFGAVLSFIAGVVYAIFGSLDKGVGMLNFFFFGGISLFSAAMYIGQ